MEIPEEQRTTTDTHQLWKFREWLSRMRHSGRTHGRVVNCLAVRLEPSACPKQRLNHSCGKPTIAGWAKVYLEVTSLRYRANQQMNETRCICAGAALVSIILCDCLRYGTVSISIL